MELTQQVSQLLVFFILFYFIFCFTFPNTYLSSFQNYGLSTFQIFWQIFFHWDNEKKYLTKKHTEILEYPSYAAQTVKEMRNESLNVCLRRRRLMEQFM